MRLDVSPERGFRRLPAQRDPKKNEINERLHAWHARDCGPASILEVAKQRLQLFHQTDVSGGPRRLGSKAPRPPLCLMRALESDTGGDDDEEEAAAAEP